VNKWKFRFPAHGYLPFLFPGLITRLSDDKYPGAGGEREDDEGIFEVMQSGFSGKLSTGNA
jgi:hypothetical protein